MLSVPVHGQAARAQRRGCSRRPAARGPRCCVAAPPAAPAPASGGAEQSSEVAVAAAALPGSWAAARSPAEQRALLLAVIKPPLYSVALAPVLVGFAAAVVAGCAPQPRLLCGCALSACAVVAWLNLSNDAWDAETAVDAAKAESAVRLAGGNARAVARLASACLAAGVLGFVSLLLPLGAAAALPAAALAGALLCGVLYQAPPFRLSYRGLGEPLCFAAFGPLATGAFYAVAAAASAAAAPAGSAAARAAAAQAGRLFPAAVVAALLVGGTTTAILFCSHFHQLETDAAAGKRSPIVRLGTSRAASALFWWAVGVHALAVAASLAGLLPLPAAAASLACAPLARRMVGFVASHHAEPGVVRTAKFGAVRWHAAHSLALTVGLAFLR